MKYVFTTIIIIAFILIFLPKSFADNIKSDFVFVDLQESYFLDEYFDIRFEKTTRQPCPSYNISVQLEGNLKSKIIYGVEPLCSVAGMVEPYLFSTSFDGADFDSVGVYLVEIKLDGETIKKKIKILENPAPRIFPYGQGILNFDKSDPDCLDLIIPDIILTNYKEKIPNVDDNPNDFFVILENQNDSIYIQTALPGGYDKQWYLWDLKKEDKQLYHSLSANNGNMAILLIADDIEEMILQTSQTEYFVMENRNRDHLVPFIGYGQYQFGVILYNSPNSPWTGHDKCVLRLDWQFKIDDDIIADTPIIESGKIRNITLMFSPLKQQSMGMSPYAINCQNNYVLIMQNDPSGDDRPACVKKNSVEKLVTRGWFVPSKW